MIATQNITRINLKKEYKSTWLLYSSISFLSVLPNPPKFSTKLALHYEIMHDHSYPINTFLFPDKPSYREKINKKQRKLHFPNNGTDWMEIFLPLEGLPGEFSYIIRCSTTRAMHWTTCSLPENLPTERKLTKIEKIGIFLKTVFIGSGFSDHQKGCREHYNASSGLALQEQ